MRNLIIRRNKSFVGCAAILKVYISDPAVCDLTIHSTPCRLLGTLKNGETVAFRIPDSEARIYVIADKLSRNWDCEYCTVPAGAMDIFLSGSCRFDPFQGNPFHFDGNFQTGKKRNTGWKAAIVILGILALTGVSLAANLLPNYLVKKQRSQPQTFSDEGMQITLTKAFQETDVAEYGFTLGYASDDTAIYILKEEFSLSDGFENLSLDQYAQLVIANNPNLGNGTPNHEQGFTIYEYTTISQEDGKPYSYLIVFLKGPDAFWMFEFSTHANQAEEMRQTYLDYAATIRFPGAAI